MSMTYANPSNRSAAEAPAGSGVFVPRYAQTRKSRKPVKTWMILAPIGALAVAGTAAAIMMGGENTQAPAGPAPTALTESTQMQTAPAALRSADTQPVATPLALEAPAPQPIQAQPAAPHRAEPAPRRVAPAREAEAAPAPSAAAMESSGPQPYSADATTGLNTAPAPSAQAPISVRVPPTPTVTVQPAG